MNPLALNDSFLLTVFCSHHVGLNIQAPKSIIYMLTAADVQMSPITKKVKGVKWVAMKVSSLPVDILASVQCVCVCVCIHVRMCLRCLNDSLAPRQSGQLVSLSESS